MKKFNILLVGIAIMAGWSMAGCKSQSESENTGTIHEIQPGDSIKISNVDKVTIINFNDTLTPHFIAGAEKYKDKALFYSVDIDNNPDFAQQFNISDSDIPTIVIINPNGDIDTHVGLLDENEFFALIDKNIEIVHEVQPGDNIKTSDVDKVTVIDFNATWCGPCKQFAPHFLAGAEKYNGKALFYSVDIDNNPDLAQQFNVKYIPTVVFINPNGDIDTSVGLLDKDVFFDLIEKSLEKASQK